MSDGYTHDPEAFDGEGTEGATEVDGEGPTEVDGDPATEVDVDSTTDAQGTHPHAADRKFDWRGWTLVAAVFVAFLVVPGVIYLYPRVGSSFGLSFWDTYLALPMIPAIVLGILAVWATTRP